jgi:hypothetical protein
MNLSTIASSKIDNFIESLNLPKDCCVLFETVEDCQEFFESFYMRNRYVADDLEDFRDNKIEKSEITLDLFLKKCYTINMKQAFESTFYQSFTIAKIKLIEEAIATGKTTLEQLFVDFKKNPHKNILKNIL